MNFKSELGTSSTLALSLPHLIVFRILKVTSLPNNMPTLSWKPVQGASFYTVKLVGPEEVILEEKVPSTDERCSTDKVIYSVETPLLAENDYLLTVEVDSDKSYLDSSKANDDEDSLHMKKGTERISEIKWPDKLQATVRARLDHSLTYRNELIQTLQALVDQGSQTDIIDFMLYSLRGASALKSLAEASSSNEVIEVLVELESQLAAVSVTLGDYLSMSGKPKSLFKDHYSKAIELALSTQNNLDGLTATPQNTSIAVLRSATSVPSYCAAWYNHSPAQCCSSTKCRGYHKCLQVNP